MSRPRYDWWGYVKGMIKRYPALEKINPVGTYARELAAVRQAVETTAEMSGGADRLKIVDMVFWQRTHTLAGAAVEIPCSYMTARRYHNDFIKKVAKNFGLMDEG